MASPAASGDQERLARHLAGWLEQSIVAGGGRGAVVGVSGGIDSAVVAALCKRAFPSLTMALILPCESDPADSADAELVVRHFRVASCTVDLSATFRGLAGELHASCSEVPADDRATVANLKARLRMATLYAFANHLGYRVVGTGNASELAVGYFTKYGDGGVDLLPLGNVTKTAVRALAAHLGVPQRIVERAPSAGLWPGQTDEGELGFTYDELDAYLAGERGPHAGEIDRLVAASAHKRAPAPLAPPLDAA
jgi:NAD+ synthase